MLSCLEMTELATAYVEGQLRPGTRLRFLMHLSMCRHCRLYLRQLRLTVSAVGKLPRPVQAPAPDVRDALLKQFRNWKP